MRPNLARKLRKLADLLDPRCEPQGRRTVLNYVLKIDAASAEETLQKLTTQIRELKAAASPETN